MGLWGRRGIKKLRGGSTLEKEEEFYAVMPERK